MAYIHRQSSGYSRFIKDKAKYGFVLAPVTFLMVGLSCIGSQLKKKEGSKGLIFMRLNSFKQSLDLGFIFSVPDSVSILTG